MQTYMKVIVATAGLLCLARPCISTAADSHPAYLHALEDLKMAQAAILARGGSTDMKLHEQNAVHHTENAQWGIYSHLAPEDKKSVKVLPAADTDPSKSIGGLHDARIYLQKAISDSNEAESNAAAASFRNRDVEEIQAALNEVNAAITDYAQHR